jgi:Flp pilus assembly protein protease CpaA
MQMNERLGFVLLAVWLILMGLNQLISMSVLNVIMGLLALAAGIIFLVPEVRRRGRR